MSQHLRFSRKRRLSAHLPAAIGLFAILGGIVGLSATDPASEEDVTGTIVERPLALQAVSPSSVEPEASTSTDALTAHSAESVLSTIDASAEQALDLAKPLLEPLSHLETTEAKSAISTHTDSTNANANLAAERSRPDSPAEQIIKEVPAEETLAYTVRKNDSLGLIFKRANLSHSDLNKVLALSPSKKHLKSIHPGDVFKITRDNKSNQLISLAYSLTPFDTFIVFRDEDGFATTVESAPKTTKTLTASGEIESSLFNAAQSSDIPDSITMKLAEVFGWDIDFALDLREGDRFTVVYEGIYRDDKLVSGGRLLAAEFVNGNQEHRALWFANSRYDGYYDPDGKPMRKAFLKSPVKFSRISSKFQPKRWHPILKKWRAHRGVDYAAKTGTPVYSTSDGKIKTIGWMKGYGKVVMIDHGRGYMTVYGHLSKFAKNLKRGSRVKQGQLIGRVGSTGYATGPHLHYEVRINNKYKDPLKVKLPGAPPLPKKYMATFKANTKQYLAQLDQAKRTVVAKTGEITTIK